VDEGLGKNARDVAIGARDQLGELLVRT
jgi:hypothetical protein